MQLERYRLPRLALHPYQAWNKLKDPELRAVQLDDTT